MKSNILADFPALSAVLATVFLGPITLSAASPVQESFRAGLAAEEVTRDLPEAIRLYEAALRLHAEDRSAAATALVRIADIHKRQGQTSAALGAYRRVLTEFADQTNLVQIAQAQLPPPEAVARAVNNRNGAAQRRELIEKEIQLMEFDVNELRRRVDSGVASTAELRKAERDLLRLRREQIEGETPADLLDLVEPKNPAVVPSEARPILRQHELEDKLRRHEELLTVGPKDAARFYLREQPTSRLSSIQAKLDDLDLRAIELRARTPKDNAEKQELALAMESFQRQRRELMDLREQEVSSIRESIELQLKLLTRQLDELKAKRADRGR